MWKDIVQNIIDNTYRIWYSQNEIWISSLLHIIQENFDTYFNDENINDFISYIYTLKPFKSEISENNVILTMCFVLHCICKNPDKFTKQKLLSLIMKPEILLGSVKSALITPDASNKKSLYNLNFSGLEPTMFQTYLINLTNNIFSSLTPYEWLNNISPLFAHRNSTEIEDLTIRCKKIIDDLKKYNKKNIIYMDGHGRTLAHFINEIYKKRLEGDVFYNGKFTILNAEITYNTHSWHESFFPKSGDNINIININCNIFELIKRCGIDGLTDCSYYLNFCGVGNSAEELKNFINEYLEISKYHNVGSCYISVSYIRGAKKQIDDIFRDIDGNFKYKIVNEKRIDFLTFEIFEFKVFSVPAPSSSFLYTFN